MASSAAEKEKVDLVVDPIESEDEGMSSGVDDGAGAGFSVPPRKKTAKGVRRTSFSKPVRSNRFGLKLQPLSKADLDRMSLQCRALSAKMGAEDTGGEGAGTEETSDPIDVAQATVEWWCCTVGVMFCEVSVKDSFFFTLCRQLPCVCKDTPRSEGRRSLRVSLAQPSGSSQKSAAFACSTSQLRFGGHDTLVT